ncbi:alpha/beta fold hydrolase [Priestia endophytica]|uniref:Alpha/beta hydrolase n=1 Tax=Priestia endophytica TaxID=135735 RepID=A0AAX1Q1H8_9BACI|nr:alpha/beta fold hydrolase [Priestia endophytica]RAS72010.1 alpha/beta hydrolase [Priestia endophytica]RAS89645.1 alpha/beta hydrolase [Priestia endophytica]
MKKGIKYSLIAVFVLLLIGVGGFFVWSQLTYEPSKELTTLVNIENIQHEDDAVILQPKKSNGKGIILYPGAKVEPEAYSYYEKKLAEDGYFVAIPHVLLNFSIFDQNRAKDIIEKYDDIKEWYIGGHSLGGVSAASYAYKHPKEINGVIFLGSYPTENDDFSEKELPMLSLYGELDGLSTKKKIAQTNHLLSKDAVVHEIKGGNHAQFGLYGKQKGDNKATITPKQQQDEMVRVTKEWLQKVS